MYIMIILLKKIIYHFSSGFLLGKFQNLVLKYDKLGLNLISIKFHFDRKFAKNGRCWSHSVRKTYSISFP